MTEMYCPECGEQMIYVPDSQTYYCDNCEGDKL
jgi:predicted RNA-binding Zn-ribbon protein involved in translation (DUF1610 family)